jgi:hypothetical protein
MKENMNANDPKLSALLRESRGSLELQPRFQQNVWRRIETAEAPIKSASWIDALAALILRPKFAFASVGVLLAAGVVFGTLEGSHTARQDAQARYVASVAPDSVR